MAKHTPGPWEAYHVNSAGWSVRKASPREGYSSPDPVCNMAWWQFDIPGIIDNQISGANAKLIAAAPEMLAALKMVMQHGRIDDSVSRMSQVAAAITKAEMTIG